MSDWQDVMTEFKDASLRELAEVIARLREQVKELATMNSNGCDLLAKEIARREKLTETLKDALALVRNPGPLLGYQHTAMDRMRDKILAAMATDASD